MGRVGLFYLVLLLLGGCASGPYHYGVDGQNVVDAPKAPRMDKQIMVGPPNAFWDSSDWFNPNSLLAKLILWNINLDSHTVSDETLQYLGDYIAANNLDHVQVLVNDYKPGNQWRRLAQNRTVGGGWRWTFGLLSVVGYTIMPGRFFGGDAYNPYTNTIYLYSDDPAIALHEAGHAKDHNNKQWKGSYSALYMLPLAPLYFEAVASNDALSYLQEKGMTDQQKEAYKTLHPAYGTYASGSVLGAYWWGTIPGAMVGHITGAISAGTTEEVEAPAEPAAEALPVSVPEG